MRYYLSVLILFLTACATEADLARSAGTWAPNFPPKFVYVDNVHEVCASIGAPYKAGQTIQACSNAWGRLQSKTCVIILPKDAPQWLIEHELLHCKYGNWHSRLSTGEPA